MTGLTTFEKATRYKLRWTPSTGGLWDIEYLWQASLEELDSIYTKLNHTLKVTSLEGLLNKPTKQHKILHLKINIVKRIFEVKENEQVQQEIKAHNKIKQVKLLSIIAQKEDETLLETSTEDLLKMVADLEV